MFDFDNNWIVSTAGLRKEIKPLNWWSEEDSKAERQRHRCNQKRTCKGEK